MRALCEAMHLIRNRHVAWRIRYPVSVYAAAIAAVRGLLGQWGVEFQDDQIF